jgi:hypothetical protein
MLKTLLINQPLNFYTISGNAVNYVISDAVTFQVQDEVFWVVTPYSGGRRVLRNVGILPQHYTASQPGRPRLETSQNGGSMDL